MTMRSLLLITGYGPGFGESIATAFSKDGYTVIGVSRRSPKSEHSPLAAYVECDLSKADQAPEALSQIISRFGPPRIVIHNAARLLISPFEETTSEAFQDIWTANCLTGFNVASAVLPEMVAAGGGSMIFTGATASLRGRRNFAAFASSKFALRGLAQALAREYGPRGIHIAHTIIDGLIWGPQTIERFDPSPASCLMPEDIAQTYLHLAEQSPSAWTHEIDLRPASEAF